MALVLAEFRRLLGMCHRERMGDNLACWDDNAGAVFAHMQRRLASQVVLVEHRLLTGPDHAK
jgi:hypothetical protein